MENVCFWCAEAKQTRFEINAGNLQHCYDLCEECEREADKGVMFVETMHTPFLQGMPPISRDSEGKFVYPTANHVCLTVEGAKRLMPSLVNVRESDRVCMDSEVFHKVFKYLTKALKGE